MLDPREISSRTPLYDTAGAVIGEQIFYSDGSSVKNYSQKAENSTELSDIIKNYAANGNLISTYVSYADGTATADITVQNSEGTNSYLTGHYDENGWLVQQSLSSGLGSSISYYDVVDGKYWSSKNVTYDLSGRVTNDQIVRDNGSYDIANWNIYGSGTLNVGIEYYDADGLRINTIQINNPSSGTQLGISQDLNGDGSIDLTNTITRNANGTESTTVQTWVNGAVTGATTTTVDPASSLIDNSWLTTINVVDLGTIPIGQRPFLTDPTGTVAGGLVIGGADVSVVFPTINNDGIFSNSPGGIISGGWRPGAQELSDEASNQHDLITPTTGLAIFAGLDDGSWQVNAPAADYAAGGIGSYINIDPLVLDLDGDGIELSNWIENAVYFETNVTRDNPSDPWVSDGKRHHTGWVNGDNAILVFRPTAATALDRPATGSGQYL